MEPQPNPRSAESLSALMDGQLPDDEARPWWSAHAGDPDMAQRWQHYHLIGEVLRHPGHGGQDGFRLSDEALTRRILASVDSLPMDRSEHDAKGVQGVAQAPAGGSRTGAANDATFRWRAWTGAAAAVAVLSVALNLWQMNGVERQAQLDARGASPVLAAPDGLPSGRNAVVVASGDASSPPALIRDPRLDELLLAHRQAGVTSALQSPSGFLRHATFEGGR